MKQIEEISIYKYYKDKVKVYTLILWHFIENEKQMINHHSY